MKIALGNYQKQYILGFVLEPALIVVIPSGKSFSLNALSHS